MAKGIKNISPWAWVPTLYLAEGLPLFIITSLTTYLFKDLGFPNSQTVLFTSLIAYPWIFKPLWSPFVDSIRTKRWWVLAMQFPMAILIMLIAFLAPNGYTTIALILFAITAFCSATHDIAADGYYMLALDEKEQTFFVGIRSAFYKIASILCQFGILKLIGYLQKNDYSNSTSWTVGLLVCSAILACMAVAHTWTMPKAEQAGEPKSIRAIGREVLQPFIVFFRKPGIVLAICFMVFCRLPESVLLKLRDTFLVDPIEAGGMLLSKGQIADLNLIGILTTLVGGLGGGWWAHKAGLKRVIIPMILCIALPSIVYVYLAQYQPSEFWKLATCVGFEQFGYGVGYTACMLYMLKIADGEYKTSVFSICTAFMYIGLVLPGTVSGYIQEAIGYVNAFWVVMACCIPSIVITYLVYRKL